MRGNRTEAQQRADKNYEVKRKAKRKRNREFMKKQRALYKSKNTEYERCPICGYKVRMPCLACENDEKERTRQLASLAGLLNKWD